MSCRHGSNAVLVSRRNCATWFKKGIHLLIVGEALSQKQNMEKSWKSLMPKLGGLYCSARTVPCWRPVFEMPCRHMEQSHQPDKPHCFQTWNPTGLDGTAGHPLHGIQAIQARYSQAIVDASVNTCIYVWPTVCWFPPPPTEMVMYPICICNCKLYCIMLHMQKYIYIHIHIYIHTHIYIYTYIYICVCVCMCVYNCISRLYMCKH